MDLVRCRICDASLTETFVDLGAAPPCEAFLDAGQRSGAESFYPLHVMICGQCLLVQLPEYLPADEIFTNHYPYYSSFSTSWVDHARRYTETMIGLLGLDADSFVVEVASNDGYLLQHFRDRHVPSVGIEPTPNTAEEALAKGITTEVFFLGEASATEFVGRHRGADLVIANNVYAHVPQLGDFTRGLAQLLAPEGTLTLEVPHVQRLIEQHQYDTIYHEHFQYYTLLTAKRALALGGLTVVDVEELPTHGGSLRIYARHAQAAAGLTDAPSIVRVLQAEQDAGLHSMEGYRGFARSVEKVKRDLWRFLLDAQEQGKRVVGYGAPGKGNTLLNHCGIKADVLPFTVDRNHHKHGLFLPGTRIPVLPPGELDAARPDYVLVLPWNLKREIIEQLAYTADWGCRLVFAIPELSIEDPRNEGVQS